MPRRPNTCQLDLLDWEPPTLLRRFEPQRVRAATLQARIARAVSEALKDHDGSRADVAAAMSQYLGERVTKSALDGYASEARSDNSISFVRLIALTDVTGDLRPLQLAAELFDHAVIERRYLPAIEDAMWDDRIEEAKAHKRHARRAWKGTVR